MEEIQENMCRLCLQITAEMESIFNFKENYVQTVEEFTGIKIANEAGFPTMLCNSCLSTLKLLIAFRKKCLKSEKLLQRNRKKFKEESKNASFELTLAKTYKKSALEHSIREEFCSVELTENAGIFLEQSESDLNNENSSKTNIDEMLESEIRSGSDTHLIQSNVQNKSRKQGRAAKKQCRMEKTEKSSDKKYKSPCHVCGKLYDNFHLKFHMNVHDDIRPFMCEAENCNSAFWSPNQLKYHKRFRHSDYAPHECDVCGKKFKRKPELDFHRSFHFDPTIPCIACGKLFRHTKSLQKHMIVHTGERPFECDVCSKCFQNRSTLRVHQRVHTKEKPFPCTKCDKSFAYNCLLKAHTEKYHNSDKS